MAIKKFVYLISDKHLSTYKIGFSANPEKRLKQIQTGSDKHLTLVTKVLCENYSQVESAMQNKYSIFRVKGEWFELSNADIESFQKDCKIIDENLTYIKKCKI